MTQEKYRVAVWSGRDEVNKAKANLEFNLAQAVKGSKKDFYKCINDKRKTRQILSPLLNWSGELSTWTTLRMTQRRPRYLIPSKKHS